MLSEHVRMALSSIKAARFRSFLTMFGVIIGVVSVVTTVSLGEGITRQITGQTNEVGKDLITVRPGSLVKRDVNGDISGINLLSLLSSSKLTEKDYESIKNDSGVEKVVPLSIVPGASTYANSQYKNSFIMATSEDFSKVINHNIESGRFFGGDDSGRKVAVIGHGVAEQLFKENIPLGKTFQIRGEDFIVSGVFEKFETNPLSPEMDYNDGIYIPYESGKSLVGGEKLDSYEILVKPKEGANVNATIGALTKTLTANHAGQEDFTILSQEEVVNVASRVVSAITKAVTVMAGVALFVGGVGIMNVMLVSVTERTREIGIRKAVGATNRQIQTQFLIEAIVISIWGAVIGIILSAAINIFLRISTSLQPVITWQVIVFSAIVSVLVGVVFGMIPAIKASRKDPIEALRRS